MVLDEGREFENGEKNSGEDGEMGKDLGMDKGNIGSIDHSQNLRSGQSLKMKGGINWNTAYSASVETQNSLLAKRYCLWMYLDDNAIVTAETLRHDVGLKGKFLQSAVVSTVITELGMPVV